MDVVTPAAGQVGPVRGGGEPAVGDPDHPVQVPARQVVLHSPDDRGVACVAGERPAPHRDAVAGHCHRDHDLREVGSVVLGVPERPRPVLDRPADAVVVDRVLQVGELIGAVDFPVGGGRVDEDDVQIQVQQVRDRPEDLRGDLGQRLEQEVHRPIRLVVGEDREVVDRDPLRDPLGRGQLRPGLQRSLRDQREHDPFHLRPVQAAAGRDPPDRRPDPEPFPQLVQRPRPTQRT